MRNWGSLYRRETWRVNEAVYYRDAREKFIRNTPFPGLTACIYAAVRPNIQPLTAAELAERAISSARSPAGADRRDGISYLEQQKRRGVTTPLMPGYEAEVLAWTSGRDLGEAWVQVRASGG